MSTEKLTPFSYVVLTLVGEGGAGPHDLVRMARRGRVYWDAADSQWYAEPKRLESLGYLGSRKEPGRTRERTHYSLTAKGRRALSGWMREPTHFPRIQNEAVVRLLAADLVGEKQVLESLLPLRQELAEMTERLDAGEEIAETVPNREAYLLLNHRLARRIVEAHSEWLDEVERTLGRRRPRRNSGGSGSS